MGPTYDWVDIAVRNTATTLRKPNDLDKVIAKAPLVRSGLPSDIIVAEICGYTDRVCHRRENALVDFFFVYNTLFADLRVTLSFDEFTVDVLRFLNLAPTQLHPNSWACLQAFRMVCQLFDLTPRAEVFLFYYNTYPANPVSWVSLVSQSAKLLAFKALSDESSAITLDGRPIISGAEYLGSHCSRARMSTIDSFM